MEDELIKDVFLRESHKMMIHETEKKRLVRLNITSQQSLMGDLALKMRSIRVYNPVWSHPEDVKKLIASIDAD